MSSKNFAVAALVAVAQAEYMTLPITKNNGAVDMYIQSQDFSDLMITGGEFKLMKNNNVFLHDYPNDGQYWALKPAIRGGSVEFDVNVSSVPCGCVAGVYAVALDDAGCTEDPLDSSISNPQCRGVDLMQANPFGFNVATNPCSNGTCDAVSQCQYNMRAEAESQYGAGAYGPNGSVINTNNDFSVKTEFLSTVDYSTLWGLRTTLTQAGATVVMETDCQAYISALTTDIENGMGLVFSNWTNNTNGQVDIESGTCTAAASCDAALPKFSNVKITEYGSNEEPPSVDPTPTPPAPEPTPPDVTPATFQSFIGYTDYMSDGIWEFFLMGLDGRELTTEGTQINMGLDNRAFVLDYEQDDTTYWAYWHDLLGGSFEFEVEVNDIGCACAAGVFAVDLNDEECSWNPMGDVDVPQCQTIDMMEANSEGFNVAAQPCAFGTCEDVSQSKTSASDVDAFAYGPGSSYSIDTNQAYKVRTQFFADMDSQGEKTDLVSIKTTLTQGANTVVLEQTNSEYLQPLTAKLVNVLRIGISTYHLDASNDVSDGVCAEQCASGELRLRNLRWTANDSLNAYDPGELTFGGPAFSLTSGNCQEGCTECRESWWSNSPDTIEYNCVDDTVYKYGNECGSRDRDQCMTLGDQKCHWSFPPTDVDKWQSVNAACRTIPASYLVEDGWKYGKNPCNNPVAGNCFYGCEGACHNSFPLDSTLKWKDPMAMCRCKPL